MLIREARVFFFYLQNLLVPNNNKKRQFLIYVLPLGT